MDYNTIVFNKENHIATITMNRPQRLNAINDQMINELIAAFDYVDNDDDIRVLILTGAGQAFCSGADIDLLARAFSTQPVGVWEFIRRLQQIVLHLHRLQKPTIAMINGPATGGGFEIALACDMRIASERSNFIVAAMRRGTIPDLGATWLMPRLMGMAKAAELIFTGDSLDAEEAYRIGLLNKLVSAADLEGETMSLARRIADGPPIAIRVSKVNLYRGLEVDLETALELVSASVPLSVCSEDFQEGVNSFLEKRSAIFKGK